MVDIGVAAAVFAITFLAELPDKSLFASLVLGTRYRPGYVWVGTAAAFAVHVIIAVAAGQALVTLVPSRLKDAIVAGLFVAGAVYLLATSFRRDADEGVDAARQGNRPLSLLRVAGTICIDDNTHLILAPGQPIHYGNHGCDPNLWHTDAHTLVTRRDVRVGEELTVDYATQTVAAGFRMPCRCGAPACRQVITGNDWQIPQWRDRYQGHVVPAVARRIAAQR